MPRALLAFALAVLATGAQSAAAAPSPPAAPRPAVAPVALARCVGAPFTAAPVEPWARPTHARVRTALGPPSHAVEDVLATPGAPVTIRAKLAYGAVSKDLEHERVRVFLDACAGWAVLADVESDDEGRIAVPVPTPLAPGIYDVRVEVLGDGSVATGRVWILPRGTRLAVTDVDGTLTTKDDELLKDVAADLFEPIRSGGYVPAPYPGGAALATALVNRGYVLVYLTGRPYWLTARTREWLAAGGFPAGPLHVAASNREAVPNAGGVGAFKLAYLRSLAEQGFVVEEAYGNAMTDVSAYARAGISPESTWIIGPNGGAAGTRAVASSWEERAARVSGLPAVEQPFAIAPR